MFVLPEPLPNSEVFERLFQKGTCLIERIVSTGQITPPDQWYDQDRDEWVVLLQGEARLAYEDGREVALSVGDYLLILAHEKHRVTYTSTQPPCVWLAVHV